MLGKLRYQGLRTRIGFRVVGLSKRPDIIYRKCCTCLWSVKAFCISVCSFILKKMARMPYLLLMGSCIPLVLSCRGPRRCTSLRTQPTANVCIAQPLHGSVMRSHCVVLCRNLRGRVCVCIYDAWGKRNRTRETSHEHPESRHEPRAAKV